MTLVMTGPGLHTVRLVGGGAVSVVSSGISGYAFAGTAAGVLAAIVALGTLGLSIASNSKKKRKDYADELQAKYDEGKDDEREIADRQLAAQLARFTDMMTERDQRIGGLQASHTEAMRVMTADRDFYRNLYFNVRPSAGPPPLPPSEQGKPE